MNRLKEIREDSDIRIKDIISFLRIDRKTYWLWEKGHDIPSSMLLKLSELFGVSCDYILGNKVRDNKIEKIKVLEEILKDYKKK